MQTRITINNDEIRQAVIEYIENRGYVIINKGYTGVSLGFLAGSSDGRELDSYTAHLYVEIPQTPMVVSDPVDTLSVNEVNSLIMNEIGLMYSNDNEETPTFGLNA